MADGTTMRDDQRAPPPEELPEAIAAETGAIADEDAAALVIEVADAAAAADLEVERALADAAALAADGGGDAGADDAALADAALEAEAEADRLLSEAARLAGEEPPEVAAEEEATVDEQALAQAEAERDPEGDVAPADIEEPEEESSASLERLAAKARRVSDDQVRNAIHALLFVTDKPLGVDQIRGATGLEPKRIRKALDRLSGELREGISGVVLSEVAGGWQLRTAPEAAEYVRRLLQIKPRRLTRAALETLAIVAYRQPVTRPEIEDIRGVDCGAVIKALLDWKLLKILGKKEEVGRPLLYGTTKEFLEFFQIKDLASLPTLREFHELNEESRAIVEEELGPEAVGEIAGTMDELADPAFLEAERERVAKSEAALADLEKAMAEAEHASAEVAAGLDGKAAANEDRGEERAAR
ncbi:MAG TPA: SMC-Scp complex subunit ScpB [Vulgatibacter sp.]|nr:SMC-Scp complex subunit ScpB [Vulgatibacter sp.]